MDISKDKLRTHIEKIKANEEKTLASYKKKVASWDPELAKALALNLLNDPKKGEIRKSGHIARRGKSEGRLEIDVYLSRDYDLHHSIACIERNIEQHNAALALLDLVASDTIKSTSMRKFSRYL